MGLFDDLIASRGVGGLLAMLGASGADASHMPRQPNGHRSPGHVAFGMDTATGRPVSAEARQRAMMDDDMRAQGGFVPDDERDQMMRLAQEAERLRDMTGSGVGLPRMAPMPPRRPGPRGEVPMDYVPQRLPVEMEDGTVIPREAPRTIRRLSARSS